MSQYTCNVIPFKKEFLRVHENADKLVRFAVPDTLYEVCLNKADWLTPEGEPLFESSVYFEPDTIISRTMLHYIPEFHWIRDMADGKDYRVRAKKLRGYPSFGLMTRTPFGCEIGENIWDKFGMKRWQPFDAEKEPGGTNEQVAGPKRDFSKYDVESYDKYYKCFEEGEPIVALLKINGANQRVCCQDGEIFVGSRSQWKKESETSDFWKAYKSVPGLKDLVTTHTNLCVFGESYGNIAKMREDCPPGERRFRAFDVYDSSINRWLNFNEWAELCNKYNVPFAPIIYRGPLNSAKLKELVELDSPLNPGQCMEGVVITPEKERWHPKLGRVKAKIVSCRYFELK